MARLQDLGIIDVVKIIVQEIVSWSMIPKVIESAAEVICGGKHPCFRCVEKAEAALTAAWHDLPDGLAAKMELHEWLGMNWEEFKDWQNDRHKG